MKKKTAKTDSVASLVKALPLKFDFYHLGAVKMQDGVQDDLWSPSAQAIGFSLEGDIRSGLLIRVEFAEDLSVYMEMGNIIASQLATRLASEHGIDVLVSPPRILSAKTAQKIMNAAASGGKPYERRTYLHMHLKTVPVDAWILPIEATAGTEEFSLNDSQEQDGTQDESSKGAGNA